MKTAMQDLKETLEEYIEKSYPKVDSVYDFTVTSKIRNGIRKGAKWQADRRYSEEEVKNLTKLFLPYYFKSDKGFDDAFNEWFEQFKKK